MMSAFYAKEVPSELPFGPFVVSIAWFQTQGFEREMARLNGDLAEITC